MQRKEITLIDIGIGGRTVRMDFTEIGCEDMDWIHLVQDRVQWQALL
jgi:hypothetical protein